MHGAGAYSGIRPHNTGAYSGVPKSRIENPFQQAPLNANDQKLAQVQKSSEEIKSSLKSLYCTNQELQDKMKKLFVAVLELASCHDLDKGYTDKCEKVIQDTFDSFSLNLDESSWSEIVGMATAQLDTEIYWSTNFLSKCLPHVPRETKQKLFDIALEATTSQYCAPLYPQLISTLRNDYGGELGPQRLLAWKQWMHRS